MNVFSKQEVKIVYAGSDIFSILPLEKLINSGFKSIIVLTKPKKKQGRGQEEKHNPLAKFALNKELKVFMPEDPNKQTFLNTISQIDAKVLVTAAYGKIITTPLLSKFSMGNINIHPSLLPRWRGPSPIQTTILEGDKKTGVTLMKMVPKLDAGPIYLQKSVMINNENTELLSNKLSALAAEMIESFLPLFLERTIEPLEQDEKAVTHSKIIKKADSRINWTENAELINRKIRAYNPWPVAHCYIDNKYIRIWSSKPSDHEFTEHKPGEIIKITQDGIFVKCREKSILISGVQPEGKQKMLASDFARGYNLEGKTFS